MGEKLTTVSVICPLFNAQTEIIPFDRSIKRQKGVKIVEKQYILTKSRDHTEVVLQAANIPYQLIPKTEFSHSKTREKAAMESTGDIIVFLTQDVVIKDDDFIAKLIAPIVKGEADATYARQLTKYNNIENTLASIIIQPNLLLFRRRISRNADSKLSSFLMLLARSKPVNSAN